MLVGLLLLYVNDACVGGAGRYYEQVLKSTLGKFTVGKTQEDEFDFLGQDMAQKKDYTIEVDTDKYLRGVEKVNIPMARR